MNADIAIVGAGPIGAAAARHLAQAGRNVVIIGPPEPALEQLSAQGVYASHYDQGRIGTCLHRDNAWTHLASTSLAAYPALEQATGIRFHAPRGALHVAAPGQSSGRLAFAAASRPAIAAALTELSGGAVAERFPMLRFPAGCTVLHEGPPAGYLNPRDLVRAQLAAASIPRLPQIAHAVQPAARQIVVTLDDGRTISAQRVLIAAGPYTNGHALLPRPVALRVKSETVIFARLSAATAAAYAPMPVVSYAVADPLISDIYLLPPIRYPDGAWYIKMGANTVYDQTLRTSSASNRWIAAGPGDLGHAALQRALAALLPDLAAAEWRTGRCLITYSGHRKPLIGAAGERVFVAAGGNGTGAHLSDALGRLAADCLQDRWSSPLPKSLFRVQFADAVGWDGYLRE